MARTSSPLSIEFVLLGLLEQEPVHGYDLYKRLNSLEPVGLVWRIKQSQLYAIMDRLEVEDLVVSTIIPGESHPNRKQYSLTKSGRNEFEAWRGSPVEHGREIRMEFLAKVYFTLRKNPDTTMALIDAQHTACATWIDNLKRTLSDTPETQLYERIVFQYRLAQMIAIVDWLDVVKKEVGGK
jgi:PadR family transcriptional regulator, regulatory protein AphA